MKVINLRNDKLRIYQQILNGALAWNGGVPSFFHDIS